MLNKRKVLPPLDYLLAFESSAKCQSFAAASRELNISETAISRKIRLLELHYDVPLFVRGHKSVRLTPQGQSLLTKIEPALAVLRDASRDMFSEHQRNVVTLAATNSVASLWLMPRLRKFNAANKHLKIMLVASDNDAECLAETVDLAILRGDGEWQDHSSELLFGETVFPVCSPKYLDENLAISTLAELPNHDLIEVSSSHIEWMNWKTWLSQHHVDGLVLEQSAVFNTYPLAVQAAVDGFGVALGWGHLVDHLLKSGKLVRPVGEKDVRTKFGYYLVQSEGSAPFPEKSTVRDWLLKVSATRTRYQRRP